LLRVVRAKPGWSYFLGVVLVLAFSGFYEVMEGVVAMIVSPELGAAYLGIQGDEWDAQKDTFLAFAGAVCAMSVAWLVTRRASTEDL
jgi:putative membrane protein